ncbi:acetyl-CoA carboxylase biotin carboxyl carrier protein subunit [Longimycelium tulufanense]|uniref:Acetyl-CoA carboxylase biotin carboxyl carrier protein subunit n=1 Tax=Longimycelium tulufanense TaxID=907463 RepID=A0A8J3CAM8_9PSEU|nr:acyl-CoA carboxylase subunit epsilon [Longimycelium tulufanense]GGM66114.1 acetyl-CoA carboxylase biotin carboxyl carrier protein subunit [Longimycelium tulufanense]
MTEQNQRPVLRVVRGTPDDVELAALTAVVAGLSLAAGAAAEPAAKERSLWADPAARMRRPLHPGPRAWRASALPR